MKSDKYFETLDNEDAFKATTLIKMLRDEELMEETAKSIRRIADGEPVNKDPLKEIPNPKMRLYGIYDNYFETKKELKKFCKNKNFSMNDIFILDYFKSFAGRSDVIRKTYKNQSTFYTAVDEDGYGKYNYERSVYKGKFVWEYEYGQIREMYDAFKEKGIKLENDVYGQIDETIKELYKSLYK